MTGEVWVIGEVGPDGHLVRTGTEIATLGRRVAEQAGQDAVGIIVAAEPAAAALELAQYVPRAVQIEESRVADHAQAPIIAECVATLVAAEGPPSVILVGTSPEGRDVAGTLAALLGWGTVVNATGITLEGGGARVDATVFGGKLRTTSVFAHSSGIATVRPGSVVAEPIEAPGMVETRSGPMTLLLPIVEVIERRAEERTSVPIEDASIVVAGGAGVRGADGFRLVGELAETLHGTVGASRVAVDSGWIPYSQQVGQTGKTVAPKLYLALGISGAIQHTVGMRAAETIVSVNTDREAPIKDLSDVFVVGDLFEIVPVLIERLQDRNNST